MFIKNRRKKTRNCNLILYDGLKATVKAIISSGLTGYSTNHSDIGGFFQIDIPLIARYVRSKELFFRWAEVNAFTPIFRSHEGNRPEKGHKLYSDQETMDFFSHFAKIYAKLNPYRMSVMQEAEIKGLLVVRHLMLHYPDDPQVYDLDYQFMLGSDFLVAPVLDRGKNSIDVYLPKGKWIYIWDNSEHGSMTSGTSLKSFPAPLQKPPVFFKKGSKWG